MHQMLAEAIDLFQVGLGNCRRSEDRAVIERYLASLAPVLAEAVLGRDVLSRLPQIERLLGHTWLIDQEPFESAFAKWREFRAEYEEFAVRGMTVNERLHALSLMNDYDRAVEAKDYDAIKNILKSAHVDDDSVSRIIASIMGDA